MHVARSLTHSIREFYGSLLYRRRNRIKPFPNSVG
jgi:hypothetical protein